MIVVMRPEAARADVDHVLDVLKRHSARASVFYGEERIVIAGLGTGLGAEVLESLELLPGVDRVTPMRSAYELASREFRPRDTVVEVRGLGIGGPGFAVMAAPCSVDSREQLLALARAVAAAGAGSLRGGAFRRGIAPYLFQGLGPDDLALLDEGRRQTGLPIVAEVLEPPQVEQVAPVADVLEIGARNMQNFPLLREVGRADRPVLLTRGRSATVDEWLMAAEYVMHEGNARVILCERGIRTFETERQTTLDLSAISVIKRLSHLPVVVDPSHGAGHRYLVQPLALAAAAAGADGLIVDVHPEPGTELPESPQSLPAEGFAQLVQAVEGVLTAVGRQLARPSATAR